ncbi:MAG: dienelactone hydrolase family protein [Pseudomonadota bacterium]
MEELQSLFPNTPPMDRRGFLVTALGTGFALAVQPAMASTAIHTDSDGLLTREVQIPVADGAIPAYVAQPTRGKNFPVILVVQEIFGVHEYIKDVCRRLAKQGYQAIAPELYARQGDPRQYKEIPEILANVVSKVPDNQVIADLDACVAWVKVNGGDTARLGITGFCWGGRIVWLYTAHQPAIRAGVAWYGRLTSGTNEMTPTHPLDLVDKLNAAVLGLYAGQDGGIPLDSVEKMRAALAASGNPAARASLIQVYPDAPHAFHADYRPSYREDAAEDGWTRMLAWFNKHGV